MGKFPTTESTVAALAEELLSGLALHPDIYPAPPLTAANLSSLRDAYAEARNQTISIQAQAQQAVAAKVAALHRLIDGMKSDIRYAENATHGADDKLKLLGWSGRRAANPQLTPGQTRLLEAVRREEGEIDLAWKAPNEGGKPVAYRVLRRQRPEGSWQDAATAIATHVTLADQPRGTEFEFRVVALNRSGVGAPSNTVIIVS
jgi:hypothetical protein